MASGDNITRETYMQRGRVTTQPLDRSKIAYALIDPAHNVLLEEMDNGCITFPTLHVRDRMDQESWSECVAALTRCEIGYTENLGPTTLPGDETTIEHYGFWVKPRCRSPEIGRLKGRSLKWYPIDTVVVNPKLTENAKKTLLDI